MLRTKRAGKYNIQVCTNVSCMLRGAYDIFDTAAYLADLGLRPDTRFFFSNHHFSHALPALFSPSGMRR